VPSAEKKLLAKSIKTIKSIIIISIFIIYVFCEVYGNKCKQKIQFTVVVHARGAGYDHRSVKITKKV